MGRRPMIWTLSNELLVSVIEYSDGPSRAALARTCHALNLLTTPYLYESADIRHGKSNEFGQTVETKYAELVRYVTVTIDDWRTNISPCRVVPCLEKLKNLESLTLDGGYWMWDTDEENWDTLEGCLWDYLEKASLQQPLESRVSTNLRSLTLDRTERNGQASFIHYSHVFIIPQLHDLTLRGFMLEEEDGEFDQHFVRQTELQSLRIERSYVNFEAIAKILRAPRALKRLRICHSESLWHHELKNAEINESTVADFVAALLPHRDTLEEIQVSVTNDHEVYDNPANVPTINAPSFRKHAAKFPVLKRWFGCDTNTLTDYLGSGKIGSSGDDGE
ncbi:hypothetical protein PENANT_c013G11438 [Penicillium antarcticum]|uniref:F-box domain-containing protein n=1 Tax=Penicillium antarcticum TaxID=416450 RepID=A0A1V6Q4X6_9EURO|nr:uncharacterized protein N7508_004102 [Penicillium antarcticum]KAJ5308723.1 hypothetical protein N7508_004102 [Penicillium antarcticum]OQD84308.1 hypothetical protein PENANT_c013G11438 [Penicillium antarcticum]